MAFVSCCLFFDRVVCLFLVAFGGILVSLTQNELFPVGGKDRFYLGVKCVQKKY